MEQKNNISEVAQLLQQVEAEYLAATRGMSGFAVTARHAAITARMENIGWFHERLLAMVGDDATRLLAEYLDTLSIENLSSGGSVL
jgi:hypothetical protein